jgi:hypothetical protein
VELFFKALMRIPTKPNGYSNRRRTLIPIEAERHSGGVRTAGRSEATLVS